ncbi:alpha/beta fold hydrolase [Longispora albida]|uniref:alpha/beta fold hydrolase n=1 Tax=Longispora albida TaxID=203523 RepID=UPI00035E7359|nr:alpha/beta hydrolase [Longispora albida]
MTQTTKYLDTAHGRIAYDEQGSGPLVLCVPGMIGLRSEYRLLTPMLVQAGYRVVTMDIRGMGETGAVWAEYGSAPIADDVIALLRHLGSGPAILVGASSGAAASAVVAATAPELVSGIVLVAPFLRDPAPSVMLSLVKFLARSPKLAVSLWKSHVVKMYAGNVPADFDEYRAALAANLAEPGRAAAASHYIRSMSHARAEDALPRISTPAVVVMGSADPDFPDPLAQAEWAAQAVRGRKVIAEGAGHQPHVQTPAVVADAIMALHRA